MAKKPAAELTPDELKKRRAIAAKCYRKAVATPGGREAFRKKRREARASREKTAEAKASNHAHQLRYMAKVRATMGDHYIKRVLINQGVQREQITPEIIEVKREHMLMVRATKALIKTLKEIENGIE